MASLAVRAMRALRSGPPRRLTRAQLSDFDRDGYVLPLQAITASEAAACRAKIEAAEKREQVTGNSLFSNGHLLYQWQHDLATKPEILDAVSDLIGPDLFIWKCQLWIKESKSDSFVGWHQDAAYWGLDPPDSVNVWLALTDVTDEHGPMQFITGSHAEPLMVHEDRYTADSLLTRGQVIPALQDLPGPDPRRVVSAVLKPGEMSIHHLCTAHGGGPNRGDDRRIGFNVTYTGPNVRSVRPDGAYAMLVRGEDKHGLFELDPHPAGLTDDERRAAYHRKQAGLARSIMDGADIGRFAEVSESRVGKNLPLHVTEIPDLLKTSLASAMLNQKSGGG